MADNGKTGGKTTGSVPEVVILAMGAASHEVAVGQKREKLATFGRWLSAFALAALLPVVGCTETEVADEDFDPALGTPGETATVHFPRSGEITIDTRSGAELMEVAQEGMIFSSERDVIEWVVNNLNAAYSYDENGDIEGATGSVTQIGDLLYVDEETNQVVYVDDYVAAVLGGRSGILTIAGKRYCLREDGCGITVVPKSLPRSSTQCNGSGDYCIKNSSFKNDLFVYKQVGSKVEQKAGGFHRERHFCWKRRIFPWYCYRNSGSNQLGLVNTYQASMDNVNGQDAAIGRLVREASGTNTTSVKQREWSLFAKIKIRNDGSFGGGAVGRTLEVKGVCARSSGRDRETGASASTSSGAGSHDRVCPSSSDVVVW